MEAARDRAEAALRLEMEAVARLKDNPAELAECQDAKTRSKRADAAFEAARRTYLNAVRKVGHGRG